MVIKRDMPVRRKRMQHPEQELQVGIFNFLRPLMEAQKYEQFIAFHVPNGGKRTGFEGRIFKAMGVMAGVADIPVLFPARSVIDRDPKRMVTLHYPPTVEWCEVKVKGGDQSPGQENFQQRVEAFGFKYRIIEAAPGDVRHAIDQMIRVLRENGVRF